MRKVGYQLNDQLRDQVWNQLMNQVSDEERRKGLNGVLSDLEGRLSSGRS